MEKEYERIYTQACMCTRTSCSMCFSFQFQIFTYFPLLEIFGRIQNVIRCYFTFWNLNILDKLGKLCKLFKIFLLYFICLCFRYNEDIGLESICSGPQPLFYQVLSSWKTVFHRLGRSGDSFRRWFKHITLCALYFYYVHWVQWVILQLTIMQNPGRAPGLVLWPGGNASSGSGCSQEALLTCSPAAHLLLCSPPPKRPWTLLWPRVGTPDLQLWWSGKINSFQVKFNVLC